MLLMREERERSPSTRQKKKRKEQMQVLENAANSFSPLWILSSLLRQWRQARWKEKMVREKKTRNEEKCVPLP